MRTRVLLADHGAAQRDACRVFLEGCGYKVETACDGLDCFSKLVARPPDAVVLGLRLLWGGADGVIARMRDGRDQRSVPVVLIAEADSSYTLAGLTGAPVVACLQGPLRLIELLQSLVAAERGKPYAAPLRESHRSGKRR